MKRDDFVYLLSEIDDDLLLREEKHGGRKRFPLRLAAVAACLCLVMGSVLVALTAFPGEDESGAESNSLVPNVSTGVDESHTPDIPDYPAGTCLLSAEELAGMMNYGAEYAPTNQYTTVYLPADKLAAPADVLPPEKWMLYRYPGETLLPPDRETFDADFAVFAEKAEAHLGIDPDSYDLEENVTDGTSAAYFKRSADLELEERSISASIIQRPMVNSYTIWSFGMGGGSLYAPMELGGKTLTIDPNKSDAEILAFLEDALPILQELFGVEYSYGEVVRRWSYDGTASITVSYFATDPGVTDETFLWYLPHISISFQNLRDGDSRLSASVIDCDRLREGVSGTYREYATVASITLEEAEAMLEKGYVFGGHSCPRCMEQQDKVDFEGYDHVELTYKSVVVPGSYFYDEFVCLPFYSFYKKLQDRENGVCEYANTLVPAFPVSGIEEYFASQAENHQ